MRLPGTAMPSTKQTAFSLFVSFSSAMDLIQEKSCLDILHSKTNAIL
jgi:hypothetical protein